MQIRTKQIQILHELRLLLDNEIAKNGFPSGTFDDAFADALLQLPSISSAKQVLQNKYQSLMAMLSK